MPSDQSVTFWIDRLKSGDPAALQPLWERYFAKLVGLARKHLRTDDRRSADEEDAALMLSIASTHGSKRKSFRNWRIAMTCGDCWW